MRTVIIGFVLFLALVYVFHRFTVNDEPAPCAPQGFPARCYNVVEDVCEIVWKKAIADCEDYIHKLPLHPGRLYGPIEHKCQLATFDKGFFYSRKSTPECNQIFNDLDGWKKRNDFK